jgi:hypothetical protein
MHTAHSHLSRSHLRRFQSNGAPLGARRWTELSNVPTKRARPLATIRCRFKLETRNTGFSRLVESVVHDWRRGRCPPKAKVTRSNRVGCARFSIFYSGMCAPRPKLRRCLIRASKQSGENRRRAQIAWQLMCRSEARYSENTKVVRSSLAALVGPVQRKFEPGPVSAS